MAKLSRSGLNDKKLFVDNPFKYLAQGLSSSVADVWEEEPVDIETFINDKRFLNNAWDEKNQRGCRPKIMEIAKGLSDPKVREGFLLLGKGSGKDYVSSILHLYGIYLCECMYSPQNFYGLSPGSAIYFINVARNEEQAKNVFFKEFIGHLHNCAWFESKYLEPGKQHVEFLKNVVALSGNSQAFSWLGYNTIQWVGDEIAFFLESNAKDEDAKDSKAEECWEAAFGSCKTRFPKHYKMIGITTPRYDDDFVMQKFESLKRRMEEGAGDAYVMQLATWDIHPSLTKEDFKDSLERDYRRTMRDFGAQPMGVITSFWGDPEFIEHNVCEFCKECPVYLQRDEQRDVYTCWENDECKANAYRGNGEFHDWFAPDYDAEYYMHFDLSKNKDKTAFSLGHVIDWVEVKLNPADLLLHDSAVDLKNLDEDDLHEERPIIKMDFIGWVDPSRGRDTRLTRNREVYYNGLLTYIINQLIEKRFNIAKATFDQFQCLVGETLIHTNRGTLQLHDVNAGDTVATRTGPGLIKNKFQYKNVPLVKITTARGNELVGTPNHKILLDNGDWKKLSDITIHDMVKMNDESYSQQLDCKEYVRLHSSVKFGRSVYARYKDLEVPCYLEEKLAELLGVIWGDGNFERGGDKVAISVVDKNHKAHIKNLIKDVFKIECCDSRGLYFSCKALGDYFRTNNLIKKSYNKTLEIPEQIMRSPNSVVGAFLRGLYDADGSVDKNDGCCVLTSSSLVLVKQVKYLLQMRFGIRANIITCERDGSEGSFGSTNSIYHLRMIGKRKLFFDCVGFSHKKKMDRLKLHIDKNGRNLRERVVKIECGLTGDVYDLEVDGDHSYVANGYISHNSHQFKQDIEDRGIETELVSLDRTDEVPVNAKNCFIENRVIYPYVRIFAKEARYLKYIGNKVDHPTGKGKDICDSVFGTVYNCQKEQTGSTHFTVVETSNRD